MFNGCTALVNAPALPATTLVGYCYYQMFAGCTSLTTTPELPATTLANYCYQNMFQGCTLLTTAPDLPATTLAEGCYLSMFKNCTSLNYIKCLATDISASNCTAAWVQNVAASGTFVKDPSMNNWTTGANGIPSGWTVVDSGNNEIYYTSSNGEIVIPAYLDPSNPAYPYIQQEMYSGISDIDVFGANIVSNIYGNGQGVITFDGDVTLIDFGAFISCYALSSITIPDSVTTIGYRAFNDCTALSSVTIPDSVTTIGEDAFQYCEALSSITIGSGVTTIGFNAFGYCTSLSTINYEGTMSQWNNISIAYSWNSNVPATAVHCTDGDVSL